MKREERKEEKGEGLIVVSLTTRCSNYICDAILFVVVPAYIAE